jgi:hypothetical protein
MAEKLPHIQFYPGDWLRDDVAGCSLAAQGLWLRMLFVAHDSSRYGYLESNGSPMQPETIARRCGCDLAQYETLLSELASAGVLGTSDNGTFYSRRMARDATIRAVRVKAGRKGGKQTAKQKRSKRTANGQQNPDSDPETDNGADSDSANAFDLFWPAVPNKVGRQAAAKAYDRAVKFLRSRPVEAGPGADDPHTFLLDRMKAFASSPKARSKFCPYPATWLNGGHYDDDPRSWQRGDDRHDPRGTLTAAQQYLKDSNGN